ncbi:MAG TPA: exodeoxyribonuclease V subunit gamma [Myxococcales bacterium]|nr:exodeoxyribonuclease V subunit gamma [Myxococcales bacterium]
MERLMEGLASRLMTPGGDPLSPRTVVVQGPGMERWIAQSIAREYGVLANTLFPFPRGFLDRVFRSIPDPAHAKANANWESGKLTWRIAKLIDSKRDESDFRPLAKHLQATDGDWRMVQLAHRVANLFDQYITFRPDLVFRWLQESTLPISADERWQARLFREIHSEIGSGHVADRALAFGQALVSKDAALVEEQLRVEFGAAVEIFAVSTLPPLYLSVIDQFATVCDVHLSVLSPSSEYWADLWREVKDESGSSDERVFDLDGPSHSATLLAGLGRLGGEFQRNLEEFSEAHDGGVDLFEVPGEASESPTILEGIQARLLRLDDVWPDVDQSQSADSPTRAMKQRVSRADDSIRVHVCHGPRRELEVILGCLREAFERDESLMPEDVLVMAPKVDEIAPDIVAVFGASSEDAQAIPYRIADRGAFRRSKVALAFHDLLGLLGGRATRSEIFDWLANESVAARFGLDSGGLEILAEWAERAGFRFGLDEDHRERMGLSRERAHTLSGAIDRLALAHAVGSSEDVFAEVSAVVLDGLGSPDLLGALGDIDQILRNAFRMTSTPKDLRTWCSELRKLLDRLFERTDANAHEHALIGEVLTDLVDSSESAAFDLAIPFEAVRERLGAAIESAPAAQPFLSGGVTFCELVPLRAIPFRVVVILGMSDDAFPRGRSAVGFDLMADHPLPGDRTTRNDDRYLFLEALLSARDQLILTVPGRDVRDGRDLPPSVVISDLLDMIEGVFELDSIDESEDAKAGSSPLRDWLVVRHPLQGSSPRYFEASKDPRLLARDAEAFRGAQVRRTVRDGDGGPPRRFLAESGTPVAPEEGLVPALSLDAMVVRILRSTRTFAREELGLRLPRPEASVEDLDPILLGGLAQFDLGNAMLDMLREGALPNEVARRLLAEASVPVDVAGRLSLHSMRSEVEVIAEIAAERCAGEALPDHEFELDLYGDAGSADGSEGAVDTGGRIVGQLAGRLDQLRTSGRVAAGFTRIGRRSELDLWIRHLVLCVLVEEGGAGSGSPLPEPNSIYVGRGDSRTSNERVVVYARVPDARVHLTRIFEWASSVALAPLPFFPRTSWEYAEKAIAEKVQQGMRGAHQTFEGGDGWNRVTPESQEELEFARIWEGWSPLDSQGSRPGAYAFDVVAEEFFRPMLLAREVYSR